MEGSGWSVPHAGLLGLGRFGSLISEWRAGCQPYDGWKDAAWAMTPCPPLGMGEVVYQSINQSTYIYISYVYIYIYV